MFRTSPKAPQSVGTSDNIPGMHEAPGLKSPLASIAKSPTTSARYTRTARPTCTALTPGLPIHVLTCGGRSDMKPLYLCWIGLAASLNAHPDLPLSISRQL